ncbi:hypothetical protein V6347_17315 [Acinetobacter baumannii]|uniref:hypothetical protein n=1 Tax=Acinetobacter baumannii TaxID=470 RepID=UPI000A375FFE|nr:hypothetical protein [Acinetobacter baumannii]EHU1238503.1 hypothetical protein [Acinetobacter baumannii]MCR0009163.1 hypothetical protein [Acinetobacter baumannii]OTT16659.1 hypothetical protein CAS85_14695 [Acinetobacter baumannii]HAV3582177.1 hypothetical protein [Acinetobacter baumannii]HCG3285186.1 hypothetical protein [Acinetobacter baumannii]
MFRTNIHDFLFNLGNETNNLLFNFVLDKQYCIPIQRKGQKNRSTSVVLKSDGAYFIHDHTNDASYSFNPECSEIKAERDVWNRAEVMLQALHKGVAA